jgi:spore coat polysaccharide biosynthesis protein SpsF
MRVIATIEARMTSSRLPGKVLLESIGKPMLQLMVERLRHLERVDDIVIATTTNKTDEPIVALAEKLGIQYYRGSENDVLTRVLEAAKANGADLIVELSGDCPLIDPVIVDQVIDAYFENDCDYATNCLTQTFPLGMETEVFSSKLLEIADTEGKTQEDREHVSWFFVRHPDRFKLFNIEALGKVKRPEIRLTLDEAADYKLIDAIFSAFENNYDSTSCGEIVDFLNCNKNLLKHNDNVVHRGDWEALSRTAVK